ncbi:iron ABC transporter permease [bacterium]|nr:iron ABC transporter permease [bacterium]
MKKNRLFPWFSLIIFLIIILFGVSILSLCTGSAAIPLKNIFDIALFGKGTTEYSILFDIRLPRIILGLAIGGGLSLAGVILQGLFRNPLVEPYTLGISGGAALGVALSVVLGWHSTLGLLILPISGFSGAIIVIIILYILSMRRGRMKIEGLLLIGVMISFISSSLIMLIMSVSRVETFQQIIFWMMGCLEESNWSLIRLAVCISFLGLLISLFFAIPLNALSLGEEEALHLGVDIEKTKRILFLLASLLTGFSVSVVGVIGFVGLVIPHLLRLFVGQDHRILLIASFLVGGSFLILCDTLARTIISPLELPVGVITGIFGGSLFVYLF